MKYKFECPECDAILMGPTKDVVVEKVKEHGSVVHDVKELSPKELEEFRDKIERM